MPDSDPIVFSLVGTVKEKLTEWRRGKQGFTLVELLVVIAIIGVLATLVLLQLGTARARARDTKRIADINQIRSAIELFFEDQGGTYPTGDMYNSITDATPGLADSQYITRMPLDPLTDEKYKYCVSASGRSFTVYALLEQRAVGALNGDVDIDSTDADWGAAAGDCQDNSDAAVSELCDDADNCIYDLGTVFD